MFFYFIWDKVFKNGPSIICGRFKKIEGIWSALSHRLKAIFVLEKRKFLSWLFVSIKNDLIMKLRLISKFMTSQSGKQMITIRMIPNNLSSKDNQAMKFGQLTKYSVRNISLQKSCRKWGGKLVPHLFLFFEKALDKVKL